ncbi:MAG: hypothetical protein Tsb0019_32960 [Roseibium sp.]
MFWERVEPILTMHLKAAVDRAYKVFAKYRLTGTIIHCDCPCCMGSDVARRMSTLPLVEIGPDLLAEYTNSAHGYDRESIEPEFKHFLPRYFDLIAHCRPPSHLGAEHCLVRLAGYRENWPRDEVDTVDAFFEAFVEACLQQGRLLKWPVGYRLEFDLGEVLAMIVLAGGDLDRTLAVIDESNAPLTAVHLASLRLELVTKDMEVYYDNAFLEEHADAAQKIGEWLQRDRVTERIMTAPGLLGSCDYDDILNLAV